MSSAFRYPGEFEPQTDVFVEWLPYAEPIKGYDALEPAVEVVRNLLDEVKIHINCCPYVEGLKESCVKALETAGIDVDRIDFTAFNEDPNSFYFRDNGPNVMVNDEGEALVVNPSWSFYGRYEKNEGLRDCSRKIGVQAAIELGCYDIVSSDMVSEGGDREFNGAGVLIAIEDTEVRKRNPEYSKEQIEEAYKKLWNVGKIIWLPQPMVDDDDFRIAPLDYKADGTPVVGSSFAAHSDEMCRFIGRNKILLAEVTEEEAASSPVSKENKRRLDACYEILRNETDLEGNPFEIIRIPTSAHIEYIQSPGDDLYDYYHELVGDAFMDGTPWPEGRDLHLFAATSYCNFLVCNGVVLGQRYWREGMDRAVKEKDEQAEAVLNRCFPDRKVVMINSLALNMAGGGVHCWTKNVFVPANAQ